jgi:hypothetical protein
MLLAMARDVRVILIKLADRLHNMRTLDTLRPDKRRRIARETLEIYAPIANRLGLNNLYRELQELAFRHVWPLRYRVLAKAIKAARGNRREVVGKILEASRRGWPRRGIEAEVMGREKHLYGIYRKMREQALSFSQVLDIYGFRVIVKDVPTCYLALGALHGLYKPVPGKFKDYIAIPKGNGYQSLHTTLIGPFGTPVEVQIRTTEMHHVAEAAWPRTGSTRTTRASPSCSSARTSGCSRCSSCSRPRATRPSSSSTSRSTSSPARSTCSRRRARSCRCRAARRRSTSPTRCTPTSATAASPAASTTS